MFTTAIITFALALLAHAVHASPAVPVKTNIGAKFPVHDLSAGGARPNTTLSTSGLHAAVVPADFPANLLLCNTVSCISCIQLDMSTLPHNECLNSGIEALSVAISQPSNSGLDFGVFVAPDGCASFTQIPAVNTCYNVNGETVSGFALA
ncbi:hypothetical protein TRAPUB_537 [Trametes pubescens]|uniref:Uncharacterized protein n=1 Tax=Trametes pubescens TaxID=154538 RepID=A0A1M2VM30_TRAPU|nr:hypothetical protein TRAPUB_537 [Trametes pubescens]